MKFTKMQGLGNDYVYVDCTSEELEDPSQISEFVSDRHFGIGSDGLILIKKSDKADFFMEMYNADGSQGEMCGNGIRCVGKYVFDNGLTDKTEITVDTLAGIKYLRLNVEDGQVTSVRVNMGSPELRPEHIPVNMPGERIINKKLVVDGQEYHITCVSMGNPHAVVYVDDVSTIDIEKTGPLFENNPVFPKRINTEFIQVADRNNLYMRVWERGSGETLACGTGACASAVASILNGLCEDSVTVHLLGGNLKILWDKKNNLVFMEGPATTVFTGEIELPEEL